MAFEIPCLLTINAYHGSFDLPNNATNPLLHPSRPVLPNMIFPTSDYAPLLFLELEST
jgi:hypothetical protein